MRGIFVFIVLSFFLGECNKPNAPDCFKQAGKFSVRKVDINGPVREVVLQSPVFLHIRHGSKEHIEIKGPENLLEKIEFKHIHKALYIKNHNSCNFVRGYRHEIHVYLYVPDLEYVRNNAVGAIDIQADVKTDSLRVESEGGDIQVHCSMIKFSASSHGNGNIYFTGSTQQAFVYLFGTNFFYGMGGSVQSYAYVEQISVGDAYIHFSGNALFHYKIHKRGNIYYSGNSVTSEGVIYGKGGIKKI
ncbi:MAG: DUF2807 domain-containing protein [Bacteroidia bacterium]|nr:DUF2807 domain-containing protein [Bacteroidia bacterium]